MVVQFILPFKLIKLLLFYFESKDRTVQLVGREGKEEYVSRDGMYEREREREGKELT